MILGSNAGCTLQIVWMVYNYDSYAISSACISKGIMKVPQDTRIFGESICSRSEHKGNYLFIFKSVYKKYEYPLSMRALAVKQIMPNQLKRKLA